MKITTLLEAQTLVKKFAEDHGWEDLPNIDKFDHLHEELIGMSQHLRYKNQEERIQFVKDNTDIFEDGIGDLLFATCRLANQLGIDVTNAFNVSSERVLAKYKDQKNAEVNLVNTNPKDIT